MVQKFFFNQKSKRKEPYEYEIQKPRLKHDVIYKKFSSAFFHKKPYYSVEKRAQERKRNE